MSARRKTKSKRPKGVRVEVRVAKADVELIRQLAKALNDPGRVTTVRTAVAPIVRDRTPSAPSLTDGTFDLGEKGEREWSETLARGRREWNSFPERVVDFSD